jgi:1,2-phenylacetyl-CoA epoxidase PaaB subunit
LADYRVCFLNNIPRNDRLYRCCQRSIVVRSARDPEQAVEAAKEQFVRAEGISNWRIHAAYIEVEPIKLDTKGASESALQEISVVPASDRQCARGMRKGRAG